MGQDVLDGGVPAARTGLPPQHHARAPVFVVGFDDEPVAVGPRVTDEIDFPTVAHRSPLAQEAGPRDVLANDRVLGG
jgi:hypothetical protein